MLHKNDGSTLTDSKYNDKMLVIRPVEMKQISFATWVQHGCDVFAAVNIFFWGRGLIQREKRG